MKSVFRIGFALVSVLFAACSGGADKNAETIAPQSQVQNIQYQILNIFPHDTTTFTEGLEWHDSVMYESGGEQGRSSLAAFNPKDGKTIRKIKLDPTYFGEGITVMGDRLYQMTWKDHAFFVYHFPDLTLIKVGSWPHEGWGMTNDGQRLIAGDGSDRLYFIDPATITETGHLSVTDESGPVDQLNELEYVDGKIYANRWHTNLIYRIDAHTGKVDGRIDLGDLFKQVGITYQPGNDEFVLNGIAYDKESKTFIVTGKQWPKMFEIRLL